MSTLTARPAPGRQLQPTVRQLARIEAVRYARHPLFVVGFALAAVVSAGRHGPEEYDYQVIPAFFIGVLGVVVAARLTRSAEPSRALVDAAPLSEAARTAALCLACLVPAGAGLLLVLEHRAFMLADPFPAWMHGTYGPTDWFVVTAVLPVVACAGGPLLGVAVGRWLRFPGATLLAVTVLLFWCNLAAYVPVESRFGHLQSSSLAARLFHVTTPYTAWASGNGDGTNPTTVVTSHTGGPIFFAVWAVALSVLAAGAALWHGADRSTRRALGTVLAGTALVALVALTLAVATGNQRLYKTTVHGAHPVAAPAQVALAHAG